MPGEPVVRVIPRKPEVVVAPTPQQAEAERRAAFAAERGWLRYPTVRELEVFQLIANGYINATICESLNLADTTVKTHVNHGMRAVRRATRSSAVAVLLRAGLIR